MSKEGEFDELVYLRDENRRLRRSLNNLSLPIDVLLKSLGFKIFRKNPSEDLICSTFCNYKDGERTLSDRQQNLYNKRQRQHTA